MEAESRRDRMRQALEAAFSPDFLSVEDESEGHRGHGGWREGGETHFRVRIAARAFAGVGRVARHRMVNAALAAEFDSGLHALAVEAKASDE